MAEAGDRVTVACPSCEQVGELDVYDIGSGPELACPHCEWCWGANGQALKPMSATEILAMVEASHEPMPPPERSLYLVRALRSVLSRFFRTPEHFSQERERIRQQHREGTADGRRSGAGGPGG